MSYLFWVALVAGTMSSVAHAQISPGGKPDLQKEVAALEAHCGYALDPVLQANVTAFQSDVKNNIFSIRFSLNMRPGKRLVAADLTFGCFVPGSSMVHDAGAGTTASEEIALEDAGGRYARHVAWERSYEGVNWGGTIAYADAIAGDGQRQPIPGYFLVCPSPDRPNSACFSLEVRKPRLTKRESDAIPALLHPVRLAHTAELGHDHSPNPPTVNPYSSTPPQSR